MTHRIYTLGFPVFFALLCLAGPVLAEEVWTGPSITFTKPDGADWNIPVNQDSLTPGVSITRQTVAGLFNIVQEASYTANVSPAGTEWAVGDIADYATLSYSDWHSYHGSCPPCVVGVPSVVHLIAEDIYIPLTMNSWTQMFGGGGFSYTRGTAEPISTADTSWGAVKALFP